MSDEPSPKPLPQDTELQRLLLRLVVKVAYGIELGAFKDIDLRKALEEAAQ